jgi:hypothetical protein
MNKNFRTKYYAQKRKEFDQLVKLPVNKINIDTLKSEVYSKWGHSIKLNVIKLDNKLHLKIEKELGHVSDYDKLNEQLEDLNIGSYLIDKIKAYSAEDISYSDIVYISLE